MSNFFNAFEMSPVPPPGPDAVAPEPFRGIYGMPSFVTVTTSNLAASTDFWIRGLGFFELFSIPGSVVHLRRWAFQDVLLVPAEGPETTDAPATSPMHVSFACVLTELEGVSAACNEVLPGSAGAPCDTPWTTRDVHVVTPEGARVVFTAARQVDRDSAEARALAAVGIAPPQEEEGR